MLTEDLRIQQIGVLEQLLEQSGLVDHNWAKAAQLVRGGLWATENKDMILGVFPTLAVRQLHRSQKQPGTTLHASVSLLNQMLQYLQLPKLRHRRLTKTVDGGVCTWEHRYRVGVPSQQPSST